MNDLHDDKNRQTDRTILKKSPDRQAVTHGLTLHFYKELCNLEHLKVLKLSFWFHGFSLMFHENILPPERNDLSSGLALRKEDIVFYLE